MMRRALGRRQCGRSCQRRVGQALARDDEACALGRRRPRTVELLLPAVTAAALVGFIGLASTAGRLALPGTIAVCELADLSPWNYFMQASISRDSKYNTTQMGLL